MSGTTYNVEMVAKLLLMHERTMMSDMESEGAVDISPSDLLKNCSEFLDKKLLRNEITKHELRNELIDLTMQRVKEESQFGFSEAALTLKYLSTEELQLRWELNIKSLGILLSIAKVCFFGDSKFTQ